jgi:Zn-dependent M28 family amino/carboxypeptidase
VAHIDSKSQPIPLVARAAGIVLLGASGVVTVLVALAQWSGAAASIDVWPWLAILAAVGALPVLASVVGARSDGAVDNASGVATVLAAAAQLPRDAAVGVLITDAEELGLAGARAWCNRRGVGTVLNCDGIDDIGKLTVMYTRPRPQRLERALRAAAELEAQPIRVIPLIPGVLVDGVAFADAGWEVATLSRGALSTLQRIHLPADNLRGMKGSGIDVAARVLARAATELTRERETWK